MSLTKLPLVNGETGANTASASKIARSRPLLAEGGLVSATLAPGRNVTGAVHVLIAMATYHVVQGRQTGMAVKEGWYVKETDGLTRIIGRRYETWQEAKDVADRLTELDKPVSSLT